MKKNINVAIARKVIPDLYNKVNESSNTITRTSYNIISKNIREKIVAILILNVKHDIANNIMLNPMSPQTKLYIKSKIERNEK